MKDIKAKLHHLLTVAAPWTAVGFVLALFLWPCASPIDVFLSLVCDVGRAEILRRPSPDGVVDAVLIRVNPGAMSSYWYHLYVLPRGQAPGKKDHPVFVAKRLLYDHYEWERPHHLLVRYREANIFAFRNLWSWRNEENLEKSYLVEIRLEPSVPGPHYLTAEGNLR